MTESIDWQKYDGRVPASVIQGEYKVSANPADHFGTILGSCVAVCLYDPVSGIGGMNHILLPGNRDQVQDRQGVHLMELLINGVLRGGGNKANMRAKVFGGAQISPLHLEIGQKNANFVKGFLRDEAIRCVSESLGGTKARKIQFVPTLGLARQKLLEPTADLQRTEAPKPVVQPMADDITLF